ncbi:MAG: B3/4 domain-containing protein [Solirubrobacterales bacterium]
MQFVVDPRIFEMMPEACFYVLAARNVLLDQPNDFTDRLMAFEVRRMSLRFDGIPVKEHPAIVPYREAFSALNINPNKYPSSIEALTTRVLKSGSMPRVNAVVDLVNAISLRYLVPMGAHDLDQLRDDLMVRPAAVGDLFQPFGGETIESPEPGEVVYASGNTVKTRRWIWRQSEDGKITESSRNILFPIDAFRGRNQESAELAVSELSRLLVDLSGCSVVTGLVDRDHPAFIM